MSIKVLIADDHKIMLEGLTTLINNQAGMTVVGAASNGYEAVQLAEKLLPDIVIIDITMPDLDGISAAERITSGSSRSASVITFRQPATVCCGIPYIRSMLRLAKPAFLPMSTVA